MEIVAINPTTGRELGRYQQASPQEVEARLGEVHRAFRSWRRTSFTHRKELMLGVASALERRREELARLMTMEMGKPIVQARAELDKCVWVCRYYAENAEAFLSPQPVETEATKSYVCFEPLGVILAVMPWNFPFWQVFRFAAPALMGGNGAVLKHASNVPGCALAIEELFREAGFPPGLFATLLLDSGRVADLISHPAVAAVTLTGSTPAGRSVAGTAGTRIKKTVLELGGSDPYIILPDADLEAAAEICVTGRLINSGQSCIAAKRFVVVSSLRPRFEELVVEKMKAAVVGDPLRDDTQVGPLARFDLRDELHHQVQSSVQRGARLLLGGSVPEGPGAFYPPTVLSDVVEGMPAYGEELFGPVAVVISAADEKEAIAIANGTAFGLGAAVFSADQERAERIAREELEAGCCFVNDLVRSDPRLPFGGVKESGYGRELGVFGIREFVNIKTVYVK